MPTDSVDIWTKSYLQAANIRDVIYRATASVLEGVSELGAVIALLETTKDFGDDTRRDIQSMLIKAREDSGRMSYRFEQLLADLDVIMRSIAESSSLTRQTKERLGVAAGHLQETGDVAMDHLNTAANAATIAGGREYLMLEGERLRRVLELVEAESLNAELLHLDTAKFKELERTFNEVSINRVMLRLDPYE